MKRLILLLVIVVLLVSRSTIELRVREGYLKVENLCWKVIDTNHLLTYGNDTFMLGENGVVTRNGIFFYQVKDSLKLTGRGYNMLFAFTQNTWFLLVSERLCDPYAG